MPTVAAHEPPSEAEGAADGAAAVVRRLLRARGLVATALGALAFAGVMGLRLSGALEASELATYDRFLRLSEPIPTEQSPVVAVRIREDDIRRFGHPLSDALLARALETLLAAGPRAIGVDLYRDAPVPRPPSGWEPGDPEPEHYRRLGETVTRSDRIVLVRKAAGGPQEVTQPPTWLEGTGQIAASDLPVDPGGIVRRGLLYLWDEDQAHVALSLQLAVRWLQGEGIEMGADPEHPDHVRIGPTSVPPFHGDDGGYAGADDRGYQFMLEYPHGTLDFPAFTFADVIEGALPEGALRDKIVLVGTTAPSVKDDFYTPYSLALSSEQQMYGVDVHAQATSQLVRWGLGRSRPLRTAGEWTEAGWILVWSALGVLLGLWSRSAAWSVAVALAALALLVLGAWELFDRGWWIPALPPALAGTAAAGLVTVYSAALERSERREVTQLFSRFLRPSVAEEIWRRRDQFMRGDQPWRPRSQWVTLTTLMLDLEGYTAASEKAEPYVLMDWVNEFANTMAELVDQHGGVVDDYAGDGIKASFGFPVPSEGERIDADARNAVRCALAMGSAMERLNASWKERDLPHGRVRIGITTGQAVVGVLGGNESLKYTSVGDTVNAAARLESFDKDGFASDPEAADWRVLVSDETHKRLDGSFRTMDLGAHRLKGKQDPVRIHRVLGENPSEAGGRGAVKPEPAGEEATR